MAKDKDERLKASEVNIPEVYGNVANISYSPYLRGDKLKSCSLLDVIVVMETAEDGF